MNLRMFCSVFRPTNDIVIIIVSVLSSLIKLWIISCSIKYLRRMQDSYNHFRIKLDKLPRSYSPISLVKWSAKNSPRMSIPSLVNLPYPFILSLLHSPLYMPLSAHKYTPNPCLLSSWKLPSYRSPLAHLYTPFPCFCPSTN